jgi:hypothetical protein
MENKKMIYKITLLFAVFFSLIELSACNQIKKVINSISEDKKVTEIKTGETYTMSWSKYDVTDSDRNLDYIKLLDDNIFIRVSDHTRHSKGYYQRDGDSKNIRVQSGTYEKEGDNFIQKTYLSYQTLSFSPDIDVKKGAIGELSDFMTGNKLFDNGEIAMTIIEKYEGYYRINSSESKSIPSDALHISKVKLPNSVDEFLAQYDLTKDN